MTTFFKYQGTGNDFVMIDNRDSTFTKDETLIKKYCDRRFGIGADGLILLENHPDLDFKMVYYNSDGKESTMCGNGGRCIIAFAKFLEIIENECIFEAIDGPHEGKIIHQDVYLKMMDVDTINVEDNDYVLNTGSPHYVQFVSNIADFNVKEKGKFIRNSKNYLRDGINVNFVEKKEDELLFVRTYERGVEEETFSCGTGVTAASLVYFKMNDITETRIQTLGGCLKVSAKKNGSGFQEIWLSGPAEFIFKGSIL